MATDQAMNVWDVDVLRSKLDARLPGFVAFWHSKRTEVHADTLLHARDIAARTFHCKKPWEVTIMLAEQNGQPVVHVADF